MSFTSRPMAGQAIRRLVFGIRQSSTKAAESQASVAAAKGLDLAKKYGSGALTAGKSILNSVSKLGGPGEKVANTVRAGIPQLASYSRIGLALGRRVAHERKITVPTSAEFNAFGQSVRTAFADSFSYPAGPASIQTRIRAIRNFNASQLAAGGVIAAEVLGFFTVGEIIGRMKLVGYRSSNHGHN